MAEKICITTLEFPPDVGGVGESVLRIAQMLTDEGYEVHVVVFRSKQRLVNEGTRRRASCTTNTHDRIHVHRIKSAAREAVPDIQDFYSDVYFYLKQLHQRYAFDLFHAFFMNETGYVTTLLAKEYNLPVINSVRGSDLHTHIFNPKNHGQMSWILANSNWVTFVSRDLQRRAIALVPDIRDRCSAFWNSIVPIEFDHLPKPALLNELSGVVIGSTGRFRGKKGMENLLDACTDLSAEVDITLLLVGDFVEKERDYWQQELATCPLGDRLRITGIVSREQALAYLPYLDIFAIPSLHDGCPNAMLEAMLAGCPIVGAKVDAIGEILADGVAGLMVEPGNTEDLKSALKQLATNPQQRQTLSQGSREKVLTDLAPDVERANWLNVYHHAFSA